MKMSKLAILFALASVAASASTISLLSGISAGESNDATGTDVVIAPAGPWAVDPGGALWISDANTGNGGIVQPNSLEPYATFFQDFEAPTAMTGTLTIWADDTAAVLLDGVVLEGPTFTPVAANCVGEPIGCTQGEGLVLDISVGAGEHEFELPVWQLYGAQTGVLYDIRLNSAGVATPEPRSAVMVGIGLGLLLLVGVGRIIAQLLNRISESRM